jgi:hypothetical protein
MKENLQIPVSTRMMPTIQTICIKYTIPNLAMRNYFFVEFVRATSIFDNHSGFMCFDCCLVIIHTMENLAAL